MSRSRWTLKALRRYRPGRRGFSCMSCSIRCLIWPLFLPRLLLLLLVLLLNIITDPLINYSSPLRKPLGSFGGCSQAFFNSSTTFFTVVLFRTLSPNSVAAWTPFCKPKAIKIFLSYWFSGNVPRLRRRRARRRLRSRFVYHWCRYFSFEFTKPITGLVVPRSSLHREDEVAIPSRRGVFKSSYFSSSLDALGRADVHLSAARADTKPNALTKAHFTIPMSCST